MRRFAAAPPVLGTYPKLRYLTADEIDTARTAGYVSERCAPADEVNRNGLDNLTEQVPELSIDDWRTRMYVIWFCYIYENLFAIRRPLGALEEIITEFHAPETIDVPGRRLATLYAGAGSDEPVTESEKRRYADLLLPHYQHALALLRKLDASQIGVRKD